MAPPGTDALTSRSRDKQPARPSPDATVSSPSAPGGTPFPPFQQQVPTTDERLTVLENSLSQLLSLLQTQQLPQQQNLSGLPQPPNPSQPLPQPPPPPPPPPTGLPTSATAFPQGSSFVPPISLNPASGMSIDRSFPHVEPALRLVIAKHEFRPCQLYRLDATVKEHPKPKAFEISDDGEFLQHERDASPKDYPSFRALYDPLVVYFEILQYFIIASGNVPASQQVVLGCSEYLMAGKVQ
ncbi:hypothetical protein JB92DRAFT_3115219 [Gautieria morchelliformis]|nr:hypothetical protein JB92DRAFT_3115219 [Gautieria morchelliformis]